MPKRFSHSEEEVGNFLDAVEEVLPISLTACDRFAEVHLLRYLDLNRTVDGLRRKFKQLHNRKIPMGYLFVPLLFARQSI
jgi:hypothetical protein